MDVGDDGASTYGDFQDASPGDPSDVQSSLASKSASSGGDAFQMKIFELLAEQKTTAETTRQATCTWQLQADGTALGKGKAPDL